VGLGDRFLGHAERCASILHLIDGTGDAIAKTYKIIRAELEAYGHGLGDKPEIVALNKVDAIPERELAKKRAALEKACGHKVHVISGVSGEGIATVLRAMARAINDRRRLRAERAERARPVAAPRTRAERQSVNYNAPVVPKARMADAEKPTTKTPAAKKSVKAVPKPERATKNAKPAKPRAKGLAAAKAKAAKLKETEAARPKPKSKARIKTGKAKAKPKAAKHSNKARANKKARR
jgi:Fe2+ transport system protein B